MRPSSSSGLHTAQRNAREPSCIFTIKRSINVEINRNVTWAFYYSQHSSSASNRESTVNTSNEQQQAAQIENDDMKKMKWNWKKSKLNYYYQTTEERQPKGLETWEDDSPVRDRVQPIQARFRFNFPPQIGFMRQRRYPMIWKIKLKFEKNRGRFKNSSLLPLSDQMLRIL